MASQFPSTRAPQHPGTSTPRLRSLHIVGAHFNFTKVAPITSTSPSSGSEGTSVQACGRCRRKSVKIRVIRGKEKN